MEQTKYYLAIDIGASSGRGIIGYYEKDDFKTKEVFRFKNFVVKENNHLIWDINYLFEQIIEGLKESFKQYPTIESLAIDTWGVDYVLLNNDKEILPVYAYRDNRTKKAIKLVHDIIDFDELYRLTGCQFQSFNTIYQLYDDKLNNRLHKATDFLMIPEYLTYKLTGKKVKEYTNASTTGLVDLKTNSFSEIIIDKLGFNKQLFDKPLYKEGHDVGFLLPEIVQKVNGNLKVKLCCSHDTASAIQAIKMEKNSPYISSGTWSLLGIKLNQPINSLKALKSNYSNEYGPHYYRFQKNIMGLWIIQNLAKELNMDFVELINHAKKSSYKEIYDVNDSAFLYADNMQEKIMMWFKNNNKVLPNNVDDIINSTFHSLAYLYHLSLNELEEITETKYDNLYIVGGGAKNQYLNELTKKYTNKNVIALPIEATAIGNLYSQIKENKYND